jgi:hypothetical protein
LELEAEQEQARLELEAEQDEFENQPLFTPTIDTYKHLVKL